MGKSRSHRKRRKKGTHRQQNEVEVVPEQNVGLEKDQGCDKSPELIDVFTPFVKRNVDKLARMMESRVECLLDALAINKVLTEEQVSLVQSKHTNADQVRQLLEEVTRKPISDEKRDLLVNLVDQTQHKFVSNFIRSNGERVEEYGDQWPLFYSEEYSRMADNKVSLCEIIDSRNGLLDEMFAAECISNRQKHLIENEETNEKMNDRLYFLLIWESLATYNEFILCLIKTKQYQVVYLLEPNRSGDIRPLTEDQRSLLQRNHATFVCTINSRDGLIAELFAANCLTSRQREYIEHPMITESESNIRLMDIVRRGSQADFDKFIECLNKTKQHHLSRVLVDGGTVALIVVTTSPETNKARRERQTVERLTAILRDTPDDRYGDLLDETRQRLDQLRRKDLTIFEAQDRHSIGIFFLTASLQGLQYLHEIYCSNELRSVMQEIFIALLKTDNADGLTDLTVGTPRWDISNYVNCLQRLNLPNLSCVYEMALKDQRLISMCDDVRSLPIDELPFELIEIILIRATGHLFVTINRTTPARAAIYTLATMLAVSHLWWEALSYRKYTKRLLKRSFKRVCHPFKCNSKQRTGVRIEGDKNVWGVAVFNSELYVACEELNIIQVFDSRPPFSRRLKDIKVKGLESARDITVCSKSSQLYIADYVQSAIWRVNLSSTEPADKFITFQWQPWSLSINSSRLLITPDDGESLYIYGDDGNKLHHIKLPPDLIATHAVETTRNTYLVSHRNRSTDEMSDHGISEFDVKGSRIGTFKTDLSSIHFNLPRYLVLANDHVLVAEHYNERIVLLKSDLRLRRILINCLRGKQPWRICLTSSRLLLVSYGRSTDIDVFQV